MTGNYDPKTNLAYWGTGNGSPWFGDQRPGDNLYTSSTLAIDADTGKIKGHFQYHWNNSWDWDEMKRRCWSTSRRTARRSGLAHAGAQRLLCTGWSAATTAPSTSWTPSAYVQQTSSRASIRTPAGRPTTRTTSPAPASTPHFCPSLWGGKDWPYEAYNPNTGMIYIPANDNHCGHLEGKVKSTWPASGGPACRSPTSASRSTRTRAPIGEIQAWDVSTGKRAWTPSTSTTPMNWGPVLTTGGGLVFAGGTNDRMFRAFDAKTGEELWHFKTNSGVEAPPSTFEVNGVQYIAVQSGWGIDAAGQQNLINNVLGEHVDVPQGGVIWVFALRK